MPQTDEKLLASKISPLIKTRSLGHTLHILDEIPSTNDWAMQLASEGASHGEVLISDSQTSGRGRLGRQWFSPPGVNIYLSVILRPKVPLERCSQLTLVVGAATSEALSEMTGQAILLKWPNDLLCSEMKLGGILCEAIIQDQSLTGVVAGIGINVSMKRVDFPQDLRTQATSLCEITEQTIDRNRVIAQLLNSMERWYQRWLDGGWGEIIQYCNERNALQGKRVLLTSGRESHKGIVQKINEEGHLELQLDSGETKTFLEGDTTII